MGSNTQRLTLSHVTSGSPSGTVAQSPAPQRSPPRPLHRVRLTLCGRLHETTPASVWSPQELASTRRADCLHQQLRLANDLMCTNLACCVRVMPFLGSSDPDAAPTLTTRTPRHPCSALDHPPLNVATSESGLRRRVKNLKVPAPARLDVCFRDSLPSPPFPAPIRPDPCTRGR